MRIFLIMTLTFSLLAGFMPAPAQAQENTAVDSATFSETFINAHLQENQNAQLTNRSVDLQPGQIILSGTTTRESKELSLTLTPSVSNGRLTFDVTAASVGGVSVDLKEWSRSDTITDILGIVDTAKGRRWVESIDVTDTDVTITWRRTNPNTPITTIVDNSLSLTMTEDYINGLPRVTNPADPMLKDLHVDLQPDQVVLTGQRIQKGGGQAAITVTFAPILVNGMITWSIKTAAVGDVPVDQSEIGQMNDDIAGSWRMFFTGLYRTGQLADVQLTDDSITLTWDADLNSPITFDPSGTLVITEEYINSAFQVSSPADYTISNVAVDLQPDQVVISANLNLPSGHVLVEQATVTPSVKNGVVSWTVTGATLDGEPLDQAIIDRFNDSIPMWWNSVVLGEFSQFAISSITVEDTMMEIRGREQF